jgi:penicillin-insensitive murein DD-endopeptidase
MKKIIVLLTLVALIPLANAKQNLWERVKRPTQHGPECVGFYTNGCVLGAEALPLSGIGYEVIRPQRKHYYGHPDLIDYLQQYGKRVQEAGLGKALIGDMAMPAGGRFSSGHRSHQSGIDVDIWLRLVNSDKDVNRAKPKPNDVVDWKKFYTNANYNSNIAKMIYLAVIDPRVERVFVNPAIKRSLCATEINKTWLRRVRPWHGHNYHMHVRLKCPAGNKRCKNQAPVGFGSGCGREVMSWDWRKKKAQACKKTIKKT